MIIDLATFTAIHTAISLLAPDMCGSHPCFLKSAHMTKLVPATVTLCLALIATALAPMPPAQAQQGSETKSRFAMSMASSFIIWSPVRARR